jgi:antitoxin component YwqK of YwqJK toxin-antitoxin module
MVMKSNKYDLEKMDEVFTRFRDFAPKLSDGRHILKEGKVLTHVYNVKNGKLNGRFESFLADGDTREKGHFINGERAGAWSICRGKDKLVKYENQLAAHIACY